MDKSQITYYNLSSKKQNMEQLLTKGKNRIQPDCFIDLFKHKNRTLHGHNCLEFAYVVSGSCKHILYTNGNEPSIAEMKKGDYIFIDYDALHMFREESNDFAIMNLLFFPSLLDQSLSGTQSLKALINHKSVGFEYDSLTINPSNHVFSDEDGKIGKIFDAALKTYIRNMPGAHQLMRCYVIQILVLTMQGILNQNPKIQPQDPTVANICNYVNSHYMDKLTLTDICRKEYFSVPYISKKFKKICGVSFEQYLQSVRIKQACALLLQSSLSVELVAERVGYTDLKSFRNVFHRLVGETPSDYRNKYISLSK